MTVQSVTTLVSITNFDDWEADILTLLHLHQLGSIVSNQINNNIKNKVVMALLRKTVHSKYHCVIRRTSNAYDAFQALTNKVRGSLKDHITLLTYKINQIQFTSLED